MRCNLVCESTPFFFLIIKNILPTSGQLSNNFEIRTFPMNPVPPVTRIFLLENQSAIDGSSEAISEKKLRNVGRNICFYNRRGLRLWNQLLQIEITIARISWTSRSHTLNDCFLYILLEMKMLPMNGDSITESPAEPQPAANATKRKVLYNQNVQIVHHYPFNLRIWTLFALERLKLSAARLYVWRNANFLL